MQHMLVRKKNTESKLNTPENFELKAKLESKVLKIAIGNMTDTFQFTRPTVIQTFVFLRSNSYSENSKMWTHKKF